MHLLSNFSPHGGQRAGKDWGSGEQTPEAVMSHWECLRASLPNAHPANTVPGEHRTSLEVWAILLERWTPGAGQWWRKGKQSQDVTLYDSFVCTTLDRHTGGERVSFSRPSYHPPAVHPSPPLPPRPPNPSQKRRTAIRSWSKKIPIDH